MKKSLLNICKTSITWTDNNKLTLLLLAFAVVIIRFFWLNYINWNTGDLSNGLHGIKIWLDSGRYTFGAEKIIDGAGLQGREMQFIGYILVIAFTKLLGLPLEYVVIIQILIALIAAYALFDATKTISKSYLAGFVAATLFLANPFIVSWHMYILTESLYTSFVILSFWSLVKVFSTKKLKYYLLSVIILLTTMFLRPNGWILLPVFLCFYLISMPVNNKIKIIGGVAIVFVFAFAMSNLSIFNKSIQITTPIDNLQQGITVWGHRELNIEMPQEPEISNKNWTGGGKYILKHPVASVKLASYRVGYCLVHIRPFHSTKYKIRVLFWILPAYIFAIFGIYFFRKKPAIYIALSIIIGHLFVIAVSYAEHDSRFDIYILPIFYMLAGLGIHSLYSGYKKTPISSLNLIY